MLYRFGAFELDDQLFQVRHAGAPVALQPRVFDLLLFLLRKRSVVVTRAELLADVWGGTVVTKDAVAQAVMALRKALGDDGELPRFIETVRARGYRFVAPVTTSATIAPPSSGAGVLTGVGAKLAKLVHHIERGGGVVLVTGEPGVGRTRFVGELGDRVPAAIVVRCAAPGAPHLWLVKEVLRELRARGASFDGVLADVVAGTFDTTSLEVPAARFAFADTFRDAVVRFAAGKPLLIVADDLHAADEPTLAVIELLAPRLRTTPVVLCATYARTSSGTTLGRRFDALLGALSHEPTVTVVRLEPFTREEVAAFLEAVTGRQLSEGLVEKIHQKTRGNALLLTQIAARESTDWLQKDVTTGPLVDSGMLRQAIGRQLDALPEDGRGVLTMAAVFGNAFAVAPLASALERGNAETLGALDDAVTAGILRRESASVYHFMYPVVRDVLHEQLAGLARARLHRLAAKALEVHIDGSDNHHRVGELAAHYVEAAATGDVEAAIDWSLRAADLAESAGDHDDAVRYAERGLAAYAFAERPDPEKRARLRAHIGS